MATLVAGYTFSATEWVTAGKLHTLVNSATISEIINAEVSTAAAIAYSKLNLTGAIKNTDITAAAGIPYSKLTLTDSIKDADIASASAITYVNLSLTNSLLNADLNASAEIELSKLVSAASASTLIAAANGEFSPVLISGDFTIDASGVGAYGAGSIVNADLNASADIALSKLVSAASGSTLLAAASGELTAVLISGDFTVASDGTGAIAAGAIINADINVSADIALTKLASAASGSTLIAGADGEFAAITITGDVALAANGASTVVSATSTSKGISELAIASEVDTGTDAGRTITPDALAGSKIGKKIIEVVPFERTTSIASGDGKCDFIIPPALNGMNLVYANACILTAGSSGDTTVMIYNVTQGADMLATAISVASGVTGFGASGGINTSEDDVVTGDVLRIDIDSIATTAGKGMLLTAEFQLP